MAWDEWEALKNEARARAQGTQLNSLGPSGGTTGGGTLPDLVVQQDDLGAVGHEAHLLFEAFRDQANISAMGENARGVDANTQAANSLSSNNFALGDAMAKMVEIWGIQSRTLLQSCAHISNHLDFTQRLHQQDDEKIGTQLQWAWGDSAVPVSAIESYFK